MYNRIKALWYTRDRQIVYVSSITFQSSREIDKKTLGLSESNKTVQLQKKQLSLKKNNNLNLKQEWLNTAAELFRL